jgi:hypothetical protein
VRDRLLQNTDSYIGLNEQRARIVHGIFENFGQAVNFLRLITLLDLLCFSIGLIEGGVSMFAPAPTPESIKLAGIYAKLCSLHINMESQFV